MTPAAQIQFHAACAARKILAGKDILPHLAGIARARYGKQ